jgi:putative oxidoreductase
MEELRRDVGLLLLRLGAGGLMLGVHGLSKLTAFSEGASKFPDPLGVGHKLSMMLAIFAEFFCSIGVMIGLLTRLAVIPIIFTMGVAFFIFHADDPFQKKELALLYSLPFVALFFTGAGGFSLDQLIGFRKEK